MKDETYEDFKAANPHLADFLPFLDQLREESPRGAVLISCGYLEEQLRQILLAFFRKSKKSESLVDGANAPLGTLSARISACFALGLITDNERHDLDLLRWIRNKFAHDLKVSFETQAVVDRCATLRFKAHDYSSKERGEVVVPPHGQFTSAATALILNLVNRAHYVSSERRIEKQWRY